MTFDQLLTFIDERHQAIKKHYGLFLDKDKQVLAGVAKVMEETGELADEVLGQLSLQRQEKLDRRKKGNLGAEIADVIITTLILAKSLNIDIKDALKKKMAEINKR